MAGTRTAQGLQIIGGGGGPGKEHRLSKRVFAANRQQASGTSRQSAHWAVVGTVYLTTGANVLYHPRAFYPGRNGSTLRTALTMRSPNANQPR